MITLAAGALDTDTPMALVQNLYGLGTLTGTTGAGAKDNVLGPQTYDYWQAIGVGDRLGVTLASAMPADCLAIAAHDCGTQGATLQFQYNLSGGAWVTAATIAPANDDPIMIIIPEITALQWGIRIASTAGAVPSIGIAYIGKRLVFPSPLAPPYVPFNLARRIELNASRSLGGQLLASRVARKGRGTTAQFTPIDGVWSDANLPSFAASYDIGAPFFFAGCPSQAPDDLGYCWRADGAGELRPAYGSGRLWVDLKLEVDAYGA